MEVQAPGPSHIIRHFDIKLHVVPQFNQKFHQAETFTLTKVVTCQARVCGIQSLDVESAGPSTNLDPQIGLTMD